jgi:hypothetical protein
MSAYLYVVFPRGKQPAAAEVRDLATFAAALAGRFAWGTCRHDGRLALAFERDTYDYVARIDPGLQPLVTCWQSRGCELLEHLAFVKDSTALRPIQTVTLPARDGREDVNLLKQDERFAAKEVAAKESVARSRLAVVQTLERYALLQRTAAALPYVLMAAAALGTLSIGLYARDRLLKSDRESRQETIERLASEPNLPDRSEEK